MSNQPEQPGQINIEISEEVSEGNYVNLAIITHSHAEFVIDFVNVMPGTPKSKVKSRIILTPFHAKRFMKAMVENVKKFEKWNYSGYGGGRNTIQFWGTCRTGINELKYTLVSEAVIAIFTHNNVVNYFYVYKRGSLFDFFC
jgi:hypothetical protein